MKTFSIDRINVVLVKPLKPTPFELLSFSSIDNAPIVDTLVQSIYVYKANENLSGANNGQAADPACILEDALSKVLVYYYPLAGKLKRESDGKFQLRCNAEGLPLIVAKATCKLSSVNYLDNIDVNFTRQCVSDYPSESDGSYHPLWLQLTKFSCGGFTIGMSLYHSIFDGFGAAQFFRALTELASGKMEPSVKPVWERERLVVATTHTDEPFHLPLDISSLATSPYLPTGLVHEFIDVTAQSIKRLKMNLIKETGQDVAKESFTTYEVLGAYVWRSRFRALKLDSNGNVCLGLTVGIRGLLDPPLPEGYYGNATVPAFVMMSGRDLDEGPLTNVVKLIKQTKKLARSKDYITTSLNIFERIRQQNVDIREIMGAASQELADWRHIGLSEDVDFGWKESVNLTPVPLDLPWVMNVCVFMPPPKFYDAMKGGIRVAALLPVTAMAKFKEEMHALVHGGIDAIAA